jgi:hypothetical protein
MEKEKSGQEKRKRGGAQPGAGRPAFVPTDKDRNLVEQLSTWGVAEHHIAALVGDGIEATTLRKYFSSELATGRAKASMGIGSTLYQKAMAGDIAALIWWTKTQMRWAEQPKVIELTGNISITEALADARARIIDVEDVEDAAMLSHAPGQRVESLGLNVEEDCEESRQRDGND